MLVGDGPSEEFSSAFGEPVFSAVFGKFFLKGKDVNSQAVYCLGADGFGAMAKLRPTALIVTQAHDCSPLRIRLWSSLGAGRCLP